MTESKLPPLHIPQEDPPIAVPTAPAAHKRATVGSSLLQIVLPVIAYTAAVGKVGHDLAISQDTPTVLYNLFFVVLLLAVAFVFMLS